MVPKVYTTSEAARVTGLSTSLLDSWSRRGIFSPSVRQAAGSGTRRLYSFDDLVQLRFVRQLKDKNWTTQKIRLAIDTIRNLMNDPNPMKNAILLDGKNTILALIKIEGNDNILIDALTPSGQQVMKIVLETLVEETKCVVERVESLVV